MYGWVGFPNMSFFFFSFFIIAEFPFRVYNAVYTIIYEMLKYDKWRILRLKNTSKLTQRNLRYYIPALY